MRLLFSVCLFLISSACLASTTPSVFLSNRKGVEEMKKSNAASAQEKFLQALSESPFDARIHLNLGLTFEILGQPDKAQASYETAAKLAKDPSTLFAANFNLGELSQKAKKKDEALKYYQEALKYNPESRETKVNIELLTQDQSGKGNGDQDQKNQDGKGQGKDQKDSKGDQPKNDKDKEGQKDKPKEYAKNKPQPRKFKSDQLSQGDVNKILGEIKQQEQKIRAEFNKKEVKEKPRDKDW